MVLVKRQTSQCPSPGIDPRKYSQLIFEKGTQAIQQRKHHLRTNGTETTRHSHEKKINKSRCRLCTFHKNKLKIYHRPKI